VRIEIILCVACLVYTFYSTTRETVQGPGQAQSSSLVAIWTLGEEEKLAVQTNRRPFLVCTALLTVRHPVGTKSAKRSPKDSSGHDRNERVTKSSFARARTRILTLSQYTFSRLLQHQKRLPPQQTLLSLPGLFSSNHES
jgi:hypothetical protein